MADVETYSLINEPSWLSYYFHLGSAHCHFHVLRTSCLPLTKNITWIVDTSYLGQFTTALQSH